MIKVHLAGGMQQNLDGNHWQNVVKHELYQVDHYNRIVFLNPLKSKELVTPEHVTRDLLSIRACDILFAYMTPENPSGIGLAAEIGYAKALGKSIIFVDATLETDQGKYVRFLHSMADNSYTSLEHGIAYLKSFVNLKI